mmetsp:Transcript_73084/g.159842  ORF Transcript_73084/g.159842 Transcript_73084/m.159842 type:complete len:123 (+) Transcript_73084:975-1343(+)
MHLARRQAVCSSLVRRWQRLELQMVPAEGLPTGLLRCLHQDVEIYLTWAVQNFETRQGLRARQTLAALRDSKSPLPEQVAVDLKAPPQQQGQILSILDLIVFWRAWRHPWRSYCPTSQTFPN